MKKNNHFSNRQKKLLHAKGKIQKMGVVETLLVKRQGKHDGSRGLPREVSPEIWESPMMVKEYAAFEEFCNKTWGTTQIELSEYYERLGMLIDKCKRMDKQLEKLKKEEPDTPSEDELNSRLNGEENLSQHQVKRRRAREASNRNSAYYSRVTNLKNRMKDLYEEMETIHNHILEINNASRIICERVKNHLVQRRNVYWDNAYTYHPQKDLMPVFAPSLPGKVEAEVLYTSQHKSLEDEAIQILKRKAHLESTLEKIIKKSSWYEEQEVA